MKTLQSVSKVIFLFLLIFVCCSHISAQEAAPSELKLNASVSEILDYLNKNSFPQALIEMEATVYGVDFRGSFDKRYESASFAQGFKLVKVEGCNITLRNDDVKVLSYGKTGSTDSDTKFLYLRKKSPDTTKRYAELYLQLNKMGFAQKRKPKPRKSGKPKVVNWWSVKFVEGNPEKGKAILIIVFDPDPGAGRDGIQAKNIVFTFRDKQASDNFNTAFRRAIKLCGGIEFTSSISGKSADAQAILR